MVGSQTLAHMPHVPLVPLVNIAMVAVALRLVTAPLAQMHHQVITTRPTVDKVAVVRTQVALHVRRDIIVLVAQALAAAHAPVAVMLRQATTTTPQVVEQAITVLIQLAATLALLARTCPVVLELRVEHVLHAALVQAVKHVMAAVVPTQATVFLAHHLQALRKP